MGVRGEKVRQKIAAEVTANAAHASGCVRLRQAGETGAAASFQPLRRYKPLRPGWQRLLVAVQGAASAWRGGGEVSPSVFPTLCGKKTREETLETPFAYHAHMRQ